ncbi:MAG: hypothetical protein A4E42_00381 [Methanoregulaceae archaeon PtaU1.Bin222]|nr:MAG: hypothetical protein A4E42_00381 [Methanoregulaceae archaeon PtaU1.Bin222]
MFARVGDGLPFEDPDTGRYSPEDACKEVILPDKCPLFRLPFSNDLVDGSSEPGDLFALHLSFFDIPVRAMAEGLHHDFFASPPGKDDERGGIALFP